MKKTMKDADSEVEKMPAVVYRIQEMMAHYNLNTNSMAKELGYTATSKLYGIMGGSAPSFGTLTDILEKWPDVSADWMVLGRGPMLRSAGGAATPTAPAKRTSAALSKSVINNGGVLVVTVDRDGQDNVEMVPVTAQAGYAIQHNEAVFVQDLPRYRLPGFEFGKFRAFEVAGDSMEPTLNHRDIVVCSIVDNWRLLVPDDMYVVVTDECVILKRIRARIEDRDGEVMLHSDNPNRRPYPLDCADITELWRVRGYISTYLPSTPDVTVERLWEVIEALGFDKNEVRRHLDESAPNHAPQ